MNKIEIVPGERVGDIYLGMPMEEVHKLLKGKKTVEKEPDSILREFYCDYEIGIEYNSDGKVLCIELTETTADIYIVTLYGMEVFKTKAEILIDNLKKKSPCVTLEKDELLSTDYEFPELGLNLWRSSAFHPKLLKDPEFLAMDKEIQQEEMQYWFFQSVSIESLT